jgi:hypothetical protein
MHDGEHSVKGQPTCLEFKKGHTQIRYKIPLFPSPRLPSNFNNRKSKVYTVLYNFQFEWIFFLVEKKRVCMEESYCLMVVSRWTNRGQESTTTKSGKNPKKYKNKSHYSACWRSVRIYKRCVPGRIKFEKKIKGLGRLGYYYGGRIQVEVEEDS